MVTGEWWLFSFVFIRSGTFEVVAGPKAIALPDAFAMLVPPRSLLAVRFSGLIEAAGFGSGRALKDMPAVPQLCALPPDAGFPQTLGASLDCVRGGFALPPDDHASSVTRRARSRLLDQRDNPRPIGDVAKALGVSLAGLSRAFRRDFRLSPKDYVQRIRIADAVLKLMEGMPILDVAMDTGFGGASRFYEQFSRVTGDTPGAYARFKGQKAGRPD